MPTGRHVPPPLCAGLCHTLVALTVVGFASFGSFFSRDKLRLDVDAVMGRRDRASLFFASVPESELQFGRSLACCHLSSLTMVVLRYWRGAAVARFV